MWGRNFPQAYDGASPGSALLSSDQTLFTPGLMQQDSGAQHFYQTDALGSVRGFTNNAQAPLGEVYFDAFGLPSARQGSMPWPLGFAGASGYQTDTDTGLMLLGNRYYDPSIGRFLSLDKVHDGNNWYAYCGNNPLTRTDPTGNVFQVSPTTMTSQGQLHGMLEGMRGSLGDDGWNHSFDAQWDAGKKAQQVQEAGVFEFDPGPVDAGLDLLKHAYKDSPALSLATDALGIYRATLYASTAYAAGTSTINGGLGVFLTTSAGGSYIPIGAGMMLRGGAVVAGGVIASGAAIVGTAYLGWEVGTLIGNSTPPGSKSTG